MTITRRQWPAGNHGLCVKREEELREREKKLVAALIHATRRNHEYHPAACSGCGDAESLLRDLGEL